jgi:hypothetical protein
MENDDGNVNDPMDFDLNVTDAEWAEWAEASRLLDEELAASARAAQSTSNKNEDNNTTVDPLGVALEEAQEKSNPKKRERDDSVDVPPSSSQPAKVSRTVAVRQPGDREPHIVTFPDSTLFALHSSKCQTARVDISAYDCFAEILRELLVQFHQSGLITNVTDAFDGFTASFKDQWAGFAAELHSNVAADQSLTRERLGIVRDILAKVVANSPLSRESWGPILYGLIREASPNKTASTIRAEFVSIVSFIIFLVSGMILWDEKSDNIIYQGQGARRYHQFRSLSGLLHPAMVSQTQIYLNYPLLCWVLDTPVEGKNGCSLQPMSFYGNPMSWFYLYPMDTQESKVNSTLMSALLQQHNPVSPEVDDQQRGPIECLTSSDPFDQQGHCLLRTRRVGVGGGLYGSANALMVSLLNGLSTIKLRSLIGPNEPSRKSRLLTQLFGIGTNPDLVNKVTLPNLLDLIPDLSQLRGTAAIQEYLAKKKDEISAYPVLINGEILNTILQFPLSETFNTNYEARSAGEMADQYMRAAKYVLKRLIETSGRKGKIWTQQRKAMDTNPYMKKFMAEFAMMACETLMRSPLAYQPPDDSQERVVLWDDLLATLEWNTIDNMVIRSLTAFEQSKETYGVADDSFAAHVSLHPQHLVFKNRFPLNSNEELQNGREAQLKFIDLSAILPVHRDKESFRKNATFTFDDKIISETSTQAPSTLVSAVFRRIMAEKARTVPDESQQMVEANIFKTFIDMSRGQYPLALPFITGSYDMTSPLAEGRIHKALQYLHLAHYWSQYFPSLGQYQFQLTNGTGPYLESPVPYVNRLHSQRVNLADDVLQYSFSPKLYLPYTPLMNFGLNPQTSLRNPGVNGLQLSRTLMDETNFLLALEDLSSRCFVISNFLVVHDSGRVFAKNNFIDYYNPPTAITVSLSNKNLDAATNQFFSRTIAEDLVPPPAVVSDPAPDEAPKKGRGRPPKTGTTTITRFWAATDDSNPDGRLHRVLKNIESLAKRVDLSHVPQPFRAHLTGTFWMEHNWNFTSRVASDRQARSLLSSVFDNDTHAPKMVVAGQLYKALLEGRLALSLSSQLWKLYIDHAPIQSVRNPQLSNSPATLLLQNRNSPFVFDRLATIDRALEVVNSTLNTSPQVKLNELVNFTALRDVLEQLHVDSQAQAAGFDFFNIPTDPENPVDTQSVEETKAWIIQTLQYALETVTIVIQKINMMTEAYDSRSMSTLFRDLMKLKSCLHLGLHGTILAPLTQFTNVIGAAADIVAHQNMAFYTVFHQTVLSGKPFNDPWYQNKVVANTKTYGEFMDSSFMDYLNTALENIIASSSIGRGAYEPLDPQKFMMPDVGRKKQLKSIPVDQAIAALSATLKSRIMFHLSDDDELPANKMQKNKKTARDAYKQELENAHQVLVDQIKTRIGDNHFSAFDGIYLILGTLAAQIQDWKKTFGKSVKDQDFYRVAILSAVQTWTEWKERTFALEDHRNKQAVYLQAKNNVTVDRLNKLGNSVISSDAMMIPFHVAPSTLYHPTDLTNPISGQQTWGHYDNNRHLQEYCSQNPTSVTVDDSRVLEKDPMNQYKLLANPASLATAKVIDPLNEKPLSPSEFILPLLDSAVAHRSLLLPHTEEWERYFGKSSSMQSTSSTSKNLTTAQSAVSVDTIFVTADHQPNPQTEFSTVAQRVNDMDALNRTFCMQSTMGESTSSQQNFTFAEPYLHFTHGAAFHAVRATINPSFPVQPGFNKGLKANEDNIYFSTNNLAPTLTGHNGISQLLQIYTLANLTCTHVREYKTWLISNLTTSNMIYHDNPKQAWSQAQLNSELARQRALLNDLLPDALIDGWSAAIGVMRSSLEECMKVISDLNFEGFQAPTLDNMLVDALPPHQSRRQRRRHQTSATSDDGNEPSTHSVWPHHQVDDDEEEEEEEDLLPLPSQRQEAQAIPPLRDSLVTFLSQTNDNFDFQFGQEDSILNDIILSHSTGEK